MGCIDLAHLGTFWKYQTHTQLSYMEIDLRENVLGVAFSKVLELKTPPSMSNPGEALQKRKQLLTPGGFLQISPDL